MTKIYCNIDNKNAVINNLNTCINLLSEVNNNFNNLYIPYDFYYRNTLSNLRYSINNDKTNLSKYKTNFVNIIDKINRNELELQSKTNKIENILINKFDI